LPDAIPPPWRNALDDASGGLIESTERIRRTLLSIAQHAAADVGAAESSILVPTRRGAALRFFVSYSPHADKLQSLSVPIEGSVAGRVYTTGQLIAVEDEPPAIALPSEPPKVYLAQPLSLSEKTLGVATYVNRVGPPPFERFNKRDVQIAGRYAVLEAIVLRHYLRVQTLCHLATSDLAQTLSRSTGEELSVNFAALDTEELGDDLWQEVAFKLSSLEGSELLLGTRIFDLLRAWQDGTLE